jgi:hypothetical protein
MRQTIFSLFCCYVTTKLQDEISANLLLYYLGSGGGEDVAGGIARHIVFDYGHHYRSH